MTRVVHDLFDAPVNSEQSGGRDWPVTAPAIPGALLTATRRAMACQFQVVLPVTMPHAAQAATAALDVIDDLERQMTVYDDSSELSAINRSASAYPVPVETRLFGLLETAVNLSRETGGAFDIATGALIRAWGYLRGPKRVPEPAEHAEALANTGCAHLVLDPCKLTIAFRRPGVELNLGAIGKGYALDRAAELLRSDWKVRSGLLHGGQSSVLAVGAPMDGPSWLISIGHPFAPGKSIATIRLRDAALGTSGASLQYVEANGRRFGHILDPRTGWPAEAQSSVSVVAPTAAVADALATAFFVLGPEKAREYCERHPEIGTILVAAPCGSEQLQVSIVGSAIGLVELEPSVAHVDPRSNDTNARRPLENV